MAKPRGRDRYQFVYVFPQMSAEDQYDPIFNVKILEISRNSEIIDNNIAVYRDKIKTLCRSGIYFKTDTYPQVNGEVNGKHFNDYHSGRQNAKNAKLSEFHIPFRNSNKKCEFTDSRELRRFFEVKGVDFAPNPNLIARIFGEGTAIAAGPLSSKYKKIRVEIRRGALANDLLTASFSVSAASEFDIHVQDISTREEGLNLRFERRFGIRD